MLTLLFYQAEQLLVEVADKKIAFPKTEEQSNNLLNVLVENPLLNKAEGISYLLIGEWEGIIKHGQKKLVWMNIKELGRFIEGDDAKCLAHFRQNYVEVVSPLNDIIGLATKEEAEHYGLMARKCYILCFNESGKLLFLAKEKLELPSGYLFVSESLDEAAPRVLLSNAEILSTPQRIKEGKVYNELLRVYYGLYKCFDGRAKGEYLSFSQLDKEINLENSKISEESKAIYKEFLRKEPKKTSSVNFKVVNRR